MEKIKMSFCPKIGKVRRERVNIEILHNGNGRDRKFETKECLFSGQCSKSDGCEWAHWEGSSWL